VNPSTEQDPARRDALIREAAARRFPAVVNCKAADGWASFPSRMLGVDRDRQHVILEYPGEFDRCPPEIVNGQSVCVSFRHGHKKCFFSAMAVGPCRFSLGAEMDMPALRLQWPSSMHELQRRLYNRSPVPEGLEIAVTLWSTAGSEPDGPRIHHGTLVDLSAGGVSVTLPSNEDPGWPGDAPVICSFASVPDGAPIQASTRLRHRHEAEGRGVQLGLQFVGLAASAQGRAILDRVIRLAARFHRARARTPGNTL
jgi:c-di-GMP-binding flagellar brake protein YcgR